MTKTRKKYPYRVSEAALFEDLRRVEKLVGRVPTSADWRDQSKYSLQMLQPRYDGWLDFLTKAGYNVEDYAFNKKKKNDKDPSLQLKLIALYKQHRTELGANPTLKEFSEYSGYPRTAILRTFRGFKELIKKSGFEYVQRKFETKRKPDAVVIRTRLDIITDLLDVFSTLKEIPYATDYGNHGLYSVPTALRLCQVDNWHGVLDLSRELLPSITAAIAPETITAYRNKLQYLKKSKQQISDKQLFDELNRIYQLLHYKPAQNDWNNYSDYSSGVPTRRFGSWANFLQAGGYNSDGYIDKPNKRRISDNDLITSLRKVAKRIKHTPTTVEYQQQAQGTERHAIGTFTRAFGSWDEAIAAANLAPLTPVLTKDLAREDLQRVQKELDKIPLSVEYIKFGRFPVRKVIDLFGKGWRDVLVNGLWLTHDEARKATNRSFKTDGELLDELKALINKLGYSPPTTLAVKKKIKVARLLNTFGSWKDVLKAANASTNPRYKRRNRKPIKL
jgi:hypothetical protein